ncbi:YciI family protein [Chitinophaga sp. sic0106]|uniref:YciI family protein n=1 Tax=Chitinophaga sp. sic0106 TaxID=2854785 RepID=UPI001C473F8C|nr:YciI family protein [Chitinophaga sp. sic0106]MBV7532734.1 YciI family protein [Chitinophaga sp. sic0106]
MASKVIPALLLLGFLVIVMLSFRPTTLRSIALTALPGKAKPAPEYEMKRYWMVFLKTGSNRTQSEAAAADIQRKHLDNITKLAEAGKIVVAGPFGDNGELRGIFIMDCKDSLEAVSLVKTDPAVVAGRLTFDIKPWWTAKNCVFK